MKFLKILIILLFIINIVVYAHTKAKSKTKFKAKTKPKNQISVPKNQISVLVNDLSLSQLHIWNFKKERYEWVLNKNSKICKSYPKDLYWQAFFSKSRKAKYIPVHKPKEANIKRLR